MLRTNKLDVFSDSLPDGWGRLLVDRYLLKHDINPFTMGNLNRLAIVSSSGGARPKLLMARNGLLVSVSGLLETSHRIPNLDYNILMKLTLQLTNDYSQIEDLFRLMCFNVFAHNRDDHSKNFTYIYNDNLNTWQLSPAYDLTYSYSLQGEHATTIDGNGSNPDIKDILSVANKIGMRTSLAKEIITNVKDCVDSFHLY